MLQFGTGFKRTIQIKYLQGRKEDHGIHCVEIGHTHQDWGLIHLVVDYNGTKKQRNSRTTHLYRGVGCGNHVCCCQIFSVRHCQSIEIKHSVSTEMAEFDNQPNGL